MEVSHRIIRQAQRGDRKAISQIYQAYVDQIYRYIAYRVGNTQDAEDITTEVFIKMIEALPTYKITGAPFEAWLYRMASARVIDMRRKSNRHTQEELADHFASSHPLPEQEVLTEEEHSELQAAFFTLSEEDQDVLYLRFVEHYSHKQVADVLGRSVTAVKSAQHRALNRLADLLGQNKVRHYLRGDQ
ncbi:sigma-70 family RNA polymerase sigma factor [Phototrophicus methaneseepsis]|uniref:Sigma-70 family RNA polymerase sigma factor n=1 Tax=Phototrophicus methaneseepsis TaxID=2710758 RepID=A0A7S8ECR5_9CHLR|nr:sigma-70 family RNA polymerase sigma factor [Phototrophicus methaneseepsis]QPC84565.1 sigma-70 family RNA polymerase sigma factor [Phototrophicus methaneseepsis]